MEIITLSLGLYQTNCYILPGENGQALVIDPGDQPQVIRRTLESRGLSCAAIALTHGHFDHVGAVEALRETYRCPVYLHKADCVQNQLYPLAPKSWSAEAYGQSFTAAGIPVTVLFTPGHTPGSVCLRVGSCLFTGDTLFAGSCGRIDLPGGNYGDMVTSLKLLRDMKEDLAVYPGHGESTTLSREQRTNPYLDGRISL